MLSIPMFADASAAKGDAGLMESAILSDSCENIIWREAVRGRPSLFGQAVGEPSSIAGASRASVAAADGVNDSRSCAPVERGV